MAEECEERCEVEGAGEVAIAPMLDVTNTFERFLLRHLSYKCILYSEMFVAETLMYSRYTDDIIDFDPCEHPLVGQLGGNNPDHFAAAAKLLEDRGYDEINVNCGCPSNLVSKKEFGARLMLKPELVRQIVDAIHSVTSLPVSVKCRIGVDDVDGYEDLRHFITTVSGVSPSIDTDSTASAIPAVSHFIVHARKCWTKGVNTRENRRIPPLRYEWVFRLLDDYPTLDFTLNGGVCSFSDLNKLLHDVSPKRHRRLRGVMVGRMVMQNPWLFRHVDEFFFNSNGPHLSRRQIIERYVEYVEQMEKKHLKWKPNPAVVSKPLNTLFAGSQRGGSVFRGVLQKKLTEQKLPFRQAVFESLKCFDDSFLDCIDNADITKLGDYRVVIEYCDCCITC